MCEHANAVVNLLIRTSADPVAQERSPRNAVHASLRQIYEKEKVTRGEASFFLFRFSPIVREAVAGTASESAPRSQNDRSAFPRIPVIPALFRKHRKQVGEIESASSIIYKLAPPSLSQSTSAPFFLC